MTCLLDTHIAYWWMVEPDNITPELRTLIMDGGERMMVSHVSLWELVVKRSAGKLRLDIAQFEREISAAGFAWLSITPDHVLACDALPVQAEHRDPFDRLLVAQAMSERMTLLTADRMLPMYGPTVRLVG